MHGQCWGHLSSLLGFGGTALGKGKRGPCTLALVLGSCTPRGIQNWAVHQLGSYGSQEAAG